MASDAPEFAGLQRQFRQRRRRERGRKLAYPVYAGALALLVYGAPAILRAVKSLQSHHHTNLTTLRIEAAAPCALVGLALLVLIALSRQALWRGPVVMSDADTAWLLPLPISRRRLLLPRYVTSGLLSLVVASLLGCVGAVVLHAYALGSMRLLLPLSMIYTCALASIGLGMGAATERSERVTALVRGARGPALVVVADLAVLAGHAARKHDLRTSDPITVTFGPLARLGLGLLGVAGALAGALWALQIPAISLRARASLGTAVSSAAYVGDLRTARLAVHGATHDRLRRLRLRAPRRAAWSVPWRDVNNLLAAPASFGWAAVWITFASSAFTIAARQPVDGRRETFPLAVAMLCGYIAAIPYTEPTRLDADDFRRTRWSPYPIRSLTTRHGITPIAFAAAGQLTAALVTMTWLDGRGEALAVGTAVATAPVLALAGMISAFRGSAPLQLMFGGPDIGFGQLGPLLVVIWYVLGPLAAIALGGMASLPALHAYHSGSPASVAIVESLAIGGASCFLLVAITRRQAQQRYAE